MIMTGRTITHPAKRLPKVQIKQPYIAATDAVESTSNSNGNSSIASIYESFRLQVPCVKINENRAPAGQSPKMVGF
jgi:hypothetical protein